ncbi:MAG: transcription antitermination factor NusB [Acidobacteria bacterium]|nr:MAG: transcription antitermination factor NusB [Acidobacteriota bacterium]
MGDRRRGREYALQMLYQVEVGETGAEETFLTFWEGKNISEDARHFAESLVNGTLRHLSEIDSVLREGLEHWRLPRIAAVDRNVLRLAVYEFLQQPQTPSIVVIDEAIELAKRFGGEESGVFVNGVLDAIRKRLEALPAPEPPSEVND